MTRVAPSLEPVTLSCGAIELVVLPGIGARLHSLRVFGHDLLRTPDEVEQHLRDPFYWGAYVMAPWCNRLRAGPVRVGGRTVDLKPNFRDGSAIHGQVYARPWEQRAETEFHVRGGADGWPWPYEVSLEVDVEQAAVRLAQSVRNLADERMPAGLGIHPWLRRPIELAIYARQAYPDNSAAPAQPQPVAGALDLRRLAPMPPDLDATWTDLEELPVLLHWPAAEISARMTARSQTLHVVAASPRELDAIAVEPQTQAPDGLRRLLHAEPGAMTWLEPGESLTLQTVLSFERHEAKGG